MATTLFVLLLLARAGKAQVMLALSLGGEGTSLVTVSPDDHLALISDGGKRGQGVLQARIGGREILPFLRENGVNQLVISCSHPHSDHMDGLVGLIKNPDILGFKTIDFIDSGFGEPGVRAQPLEEIYRATWKDRYADAGQDFTRKGDENRQLPVVARHKAEDADVLGEIEFPRKNLRLSNFQYKPREGAGPHGRCVVTIVELKDGEQTTRTSSILTMPILHSFANSPTG